MNNQTKGADMWLSWLGRTRNRSDLLDANRARAMQALLDAPPEITDGAALPPLWHWLYFWDVEPQSDLGFDGHPHRGGFLPPVDLPRRMWAGSRVSIHESPAIGDRALCRSKILKVVPKQGRSGALVFVTVRHDISVDGRLCIKDEHDIVYREAARPHDPPSQTVEAPTVAQWSRRIAPEAPLLFRYSALTFNGHRIHYDRRYCIEEEDYPGLVVHGPLLATLMLEEARKANPGRCVRSFSFLGVSPVFDTEDFAVEGKASRDTPASAEVWVRAGVRLSMRGQVEFAN